MRRAAKAPAAATGRSAARTIDASMSAAMRVAAPARPAIVRPALTALGRPAPAGGRPAPHRAVRRRRTPEVRRRRAAPMRHVAGPTTVAAKACVAGRTRDAHPTRAALGPRIDQTALPAQAGPIGRLAARPAARATTAPGSPSGRAARMTARALATGAATHRAQPGPAPGQAPAARWTPHAVRRGRSIAPPAHPPQVPLAARNGCAAPSRSPARSLPSRVIDCPRC